MEILTKETPRIVSEGIEVKIKFSDGETNLRFIDFETTPQRFLILNEMGFCILR